MKKVIAIIVAIFLIIEFGGIILKNWNKSTDDNPVDRNGVLKEGYEVEESFEKELFEKASEKEKKIQTLENTLLKVVYAFNFCVSSIKDIDNYECLSGLVDQTLFNDYTDPQERGKAIYRMFVEENEVLTGLDANSEKFDSELKLLTYQLEIFTLKSRAPKIFFVTIKDNKIIRLERRG